jgi:hypothetical protein
LEVTDEEFAAARALAPDQRYEYQWLMCFDAGHVPTTERRFDPSTRVRHSPSETSLREFGALLAA